MVVCLQIVFVCTYLKIFCVALSIFFFVNAIDTESEKNRRKSIKIIYHSFFLLLFLLFFLCFLLCCSSSSSDLSTHSRRMSKGQHNICRHFFLIVTHSLFNSRVNDLIYGLKLFTISCNLISTFNVLIIYLLYAPLFAEYCRKSFSHSFTHT